VISTARSLSPTVEVLLRCARVEAGAGLANAARVRVLLNDGIDAGALFSLAQWHSVTPLVWTSLLAIAGASLPAAITAPFEAAVKSNALRNLYLTRRLIRLLDLLQSNGIPALAYKGPALAVQAYGLPSLRQFADLDLLVRPELVSAARALLLADGFQQTWPAGALSPRQEASHRRGKYNLALRHASDQLVLELHWTITPNYLRIPPAPAELWEGLEEITLAGRRLPAFAPARLLLILCVHGGNHCWLRLNWVCDVAELVRRNPTLDWPALAGLAERWGCMRMLRLGLLLANDLLDAPLPAEARAALGQDHAAERLAAQAARRLSCDPVEWLGRFEEPAFHLRMRERWADRARYYLAMASPTVRDWRYLPLPEPLAPFYYLVRPARLFIEHGLGWRRQDL
jgi:Uncharacterised nucleotidyltransferase